MKVARCLLLAFLLAVSLHAAPKVDKVEPPNWWLSHTWNPIQMLLTGSDLKGAAIAADSKALKLDIRQVSEDGKYLFAYLTVASGARAGRHRFRLTTPSGSAEFEFLLEPQFSTRGRFQGFNPDDVIYLLMPDRFANGDPSNDSPPEFGFPANRTSQDGYHGGDFRGIINHLSYLKELGVTGVWMLPVYKNSSTRSAPSHGYHTVDFYAVEPRLGTMKELQELVAGAHSLGIKVMQDQVANHCGPYHPWLQAPPTKTWFHGLQQTPKMRNNFDIAALADPYARPKRRQVPLDGWFAGNLPDFDQSDPLMSDYLIQNALWWIGMTGVDGIRQDTYPYVDRPFWEKWQTALNRQFPGFFVVGEITAPNPAVLSFFEGGLRRYGVDTKLTSMLDFPLEGATRNVFAQGRPMTQLTDILAQDSLYQHPESLVRFLGNHDQSRFLSIAGGDASRLMMAETFLLTIPGIPHLYYGDEVALGKPPADARRATRADFPGGFPGDPANAFTPEGRAGDAAQVFEQLRGLLQFRKAHAALRRGNMVNLLIEQDRYAYLRSAPGENVLIVLNRAGEKPIELEVDDLALPEGLTFRSWQEAAPGTVVSGRKLRIEKPAGVNIYWATTSGK